MNVIWKSLPPTFLTLGWVLPEANWESSVSTWIQPRSICCHLHGEEGHEHECWPSPGCDGRGHIASKLKQKLNSEEKMSMLSGYLEKAMAPHSSTLAWRIPWTEGPGRLQSMESLRVRHDWVTSLSLFTFHFHALEKERATHSSVLAWRIPGTGEPGGLPSMGSHIVGYDWSDLAASGYSCGILEHDQAQAQYNCWESQRFLINWLIQDFLTSALLMFGLDNPLLCIEGLFGLFYVLLYIYPHHWPLPVGTNSSSLIVTPLMSLDSDRVPGSIITPVESFWNTLPSLEIC